MSLKSFYFIVCVAALCGVAKAQDEDWELSFYAQSDKTCSQASLVDLDVHWPSKCTALPAFPSIEYRDNFGTQTALAAYEVGQGGYGSVTFYSDQNCQKWVSGALVYLILQNCMSTTDSYMISGTKSTYTNGTFVSSAAEAFRGEPLLQGRAGFCPFDERACGNRICCPAAMQCAQLSDGSHTCKKSN